MNHRTKEVTKSQIHTHCSQMEMWKKNIGLKKKKRVFNQVIIRNLPNHIKRQHPQKVPLGVLLGAHRPGAENPKKKGLQQLTN